MKKFWTSVLVVCACLAVGAAVLNGSDGPKAEAANTRYADVAADAWYAEAVAYVQEQGLMNGNTATEFAPEASLTRAMLATVVYRLAGEPEVSGAPAFSDVPAGQWYSSAILWANREGVVNGYGGDLFGPNDNVTQEQMALILSRYVGQNVTGDIPGFSGGANQATRAQVAAALQRAAALRPAQTEQPNQAAANITTNGGEVISLSALAHQDADAEAKVYYTRDITPEAMVAAYRALGRELDGDKIAVKLSTGEPPASNYLAPALIADLVQLVDGTIVECNTAYGGSRASNAMHYQVAADHGFTAIADFQILDENGSVSLPVNAPAGVTTQLKENFVGAHFPEYDGYLVLSHFKGHAMAGFGGAIKNISIGLGSAEGKSWIHSGGNSRTNPWGGEQDAFTASMAEAGKSVVDALDGNILYVSVMNRLSVDCDCDGNPAEPDMHDIGILASTDPVALDQACVDLVYASKDNNTALVNRMESRQAFNVLAHGEEIGLGSRSYQLISLD